MTKNNLYRKEMEKIKKEFYTWWTPENVTEYGAGVQVSKRKVWSFISQQISKAEETGELKGVGKLLDSLWDNSYYQLGKLGSDRIEKEMIYYFGKNWMVDMYKFIGANGVHPEVVKTLKELSHKSTKEK